MSASEALAAGTGECVIPWVLPLNGGGGKHRGGGSANRAYWPPYERSGFRATPQGRGRITHARAWHATTLVCPELRPRPAGARRAEGPAGFGARHLAPER